MQSENKFFEDFAKMINGVAGTVAGVGREAENNFKEKARGWFSDLDMVSREEFDAVKAMAQKAREKSVMLEKRIEALENSIAAASAAPAAKKADTAAKDAPKTAPKKKPSGKK
ncbi:hypothetical protein LPB140_03895 [Sphingorhabdus lutea]|uniref:Accessory factor UbiK family protein n=1 Tax=Sphingorhabdus lutea TaxID=1913578 RepID=A0A1L3JAE1_9SPHN|nr:accessory factor UbiK family protein [Sphingorhabdus lutea]APG62091.1 hypothetical protein LPB140_03895 [Sphingorhabdus lutea]